MKMWLAVGFGLLVALLNLVVVKLYAVAALSPFIEIFVFAVGLFACIRFLAAGNGFGCFLWSLAAMASNLVFCVALDFVLTKKSFSISGDFDFFGLALLDYTAGLLFGCTYRWWTKHRLFGFKD